MFEKNLFRIMESYKTMIESETAGEDFTYENLVKENRIAEAMKMLMERAKKSFPNTKVVGQNGLPKIVYHGTDSEFTSFSKDKIGSHTHSVDEDGFFFVDDESYAEGMYSSNYNSLPCFLNLTNPDEYDTNDTPESMWDENPNEFSDNAISDSHDGVIIHGFSVDSENNGYYTDEEWEELQSSKDNITMYVVFEPNQIKLAKITYDGGKLIPLSKRFDTTTDDIRY